MSSCAERQLCAALSETPGSAICNTTDGQGGQSAQKHLVGTQHLNPSPLNINYVLGRVCVLLERERERGVSQQGLKWAHEPDTQPATCLPHTPPASFSISHLIGAVCKQTRINFFAVFQNLLSEKGGA